MMAFVHRFVAGLGRLFSALPGLGPSSRVVPRGPSIL